MLKGTICASRSTRAAVTCRRRLPLVSKALCLPPRPAPAGRNRRFDARRASPSLKVGSSTASRWLSCAIAGKSAPAQEPCMPGAPAAARLLLLQPCPATSRTTTHSVTVSRSAAAAASHHRLPRYEGRPGSRRRISVSIQCSTFACITPVGLRGRCWGWACRSRCRSRRAGAGSSLRGQQQAPRWRSDRHDGHAALDGQPRGTAFVGALRYRGGVRVPSGNMTHPDAQAEQVRRPLLGHLFQALGSRLRRCGSRPSAPRPAEEGWT